MRRAFLTITLGTLAVAASCSSKYDDAAPAAAPDASIMETGPIVDSGNGTAAEDAAVDAGADVDVIDSGLCADCASRQCDSDGGCYPLVFVTPEQYHGDLGATDGGTMGLARAKEICDVASGRPGRFVPWLSDDTKSAIFLVTGTPGADRPVIRPDGQRVAASYHAIAQNGTLDLPIALTFGGGVLPASDRAWTGSDTDGLAAPNHCNNWSSQTSAFVGWYGFVGSKNANWTRYSNGQYCNVNGHLYCFEVVP